VRDILLYGSGVTLGRIAWQIAAQADGFLVGRHLGAAALGIYGRAKQLAVAPTTMISLVIDRSLLPAMARVQDDLSRLQPLFLRSSRVSASLGPVGAGLLIVIAPEIVIWILGPSWTRATIPLQVLLAAIPFRLTGINETLVAARGRVFRRAGQRLGYGLLTVLLVTFLAPYGLLSVACAVTLATFAYFLFSTHLACRASELPMRSILLPNVHGLCVGASITWACIEIRALLAPIVMSSIVNAAFLSAIYLSLCWIAFLAACFPMQRRTEPHRGRGKE
jgi:O-antigen/teichoic acid export membrane protein